MSNEEFQNPPVKYHMGNEYPQTVALILSKIKPDHAAKVLALLDQNFAMNVVMRIIGMDSVQKEVLEQVEATLRREFMNNMAKTAKQDSHELVANIFNNLESQIQTNFLTDMEERNVEEAEKIIHRDLCVEKNQKFLAKGEYFYSDLVGMNVVFDNGKKIGKVSKVEEFTTYATLRVKTDEKDVLVPFVKAFIKSISLEEKLIVVNFIEGLL